VYVCVRRGGGGGRGGRQCGRRRFAAGYVLRGGAFPLRALARGGFHHLRRLVLLVPENVRLHVFGNDRQVAFLAYFHWSQYRLLPAAFPWARRHAAAYCRLSRCFRGLGPCLVAPFLPFSVV